LLVVNQCCPVNARLLEYETIFRGFRSKTIIASRGITRVDCDYLSAILRKAR